MASESTTSASAPVWRISENARSKSCGPLTLNDRAASPRACAAACVSLSSGTETGLSAFHSTATRARPGTISLKSSRRLPLTSGARIVRPVMLPCGRVRLATTPVDTRSPQAKQTMGSAALALRAAWVAATPWTSRTSTLSRTSSCAKPGSRPSFPSPHR